jgi:hydroxypyruvate isomerase
MLRFSANLGYLWKELELLDAIKAAKRSGFDAVEFHCPYDVSPTKVRDILDDEGLSAISINTMRDKEKNESGLGAIFGKDKDMRAQVDQAIRYSNVIGCLNIHVLAGNASQSLRSERVYKDNLMYATEQATRFGKNILIEVLNPLDMPGYYLNSIDRAADIISSTGVKNLKLMFDCYHFQKMGLDLRELFKTYKSIVGHIQIASFPHREEPTYNPSSYIEILDYFLDLGWSGFVGAEYSPRLCTDVGIGWLSIYKRELERRRNKNADEL